MLNRKRDRRVSLGLDLLEGRKLLSVQGAHIGVAMIQGNHIGYSMIQGNHIGYSMIQGNHIGTNAMVVTSNVETVTPDTERKH